jgi:hypothetical protein
MVFSDILQEERIRREKREERREERREKREEKREKREQLNKLSFEWLNFNIHSST